MTEPIDEAVWWMTDEEYADYLAVQTDIPERPPLGDPE